MATETNVALLGYGSVGAAHACKPQHQAGGAILVRAGLGADELGAQIV